MSTKIQESASDKTDEVESESIVEESETTYEDIVKTESEAQAEEPEQEITPSVKEFDIIARKWDFEPSTLTVNEGDTVLLHIQSLDIAHGFRLSAFSVSKYLSPGQTIDVEFVADQKGTFQFACTVYCGSGHNNMKGQFIVK